MSFGVSAMYLPSRYRRAVATESRDVPAADGPRQGRNDPPAPFYGWQVRLTDQPPAKGLSLPSANTEKALLADIIGRATTGLGNLGVPTKRPERAASSASPMSAPVRVSAPGAEPAWRKTEHGRGRIGRLAEHSAHPGPSPGHDLLPDASRGPDRPFSKASPLWHRRTSARAKQLCPLRVGWALGLGEALCPATSPRAAHPRSPFKTLSALAASASVSKATWQTNLRPRAAPEKPRMFNPWSARA